MPKLKVYCTPIGFHDAYVAAPSQKAALEAWGSEANLFARGVAEVVDDPKLTKEPLANPGKVIRRTRGSVEDHLAALPRPARKGVEKKPAAKRAAAHAAKPSRPKPPPSRSKLDAAEQALLDAERRHETETAEMRAREEALRKERRDLDARQASELDKLGRRRSQAREAYDRALDRWREAD